MGWKLAQIRCEGLSVFDGGKWWGRKPRNCRGTYHMLREVLGGPGKKRPRSTRHLLVSFNNVKMRAPVPHLHTHCITSPISVSASCSALPWSCAAAGEQPLLLR